MGDFLSDKAAYDRHDPQAIYDFSRHLIGHSLRSLLGEGAIEGKRKGKGGLGQMVEELVFGYDINNKSEADFAEAGLELKCTPLLKSKSGETLRVKERLVCSMIDYFSIVSTDFENSHLIAKCRLMLILFYLHTKGREIYDYEFLFRVLWQLPEKDLLLIKKDYETIAEKVRRGEAHLLSEGDTLYLGACRKGQKGDTAQKQPFSDIAAQRRAFSLKPAYMRYVLSHVAESGNTCYSNYTSAPSAEFELVSATDLSHKSFEDIIKARFAPFVGKNYEQICRSFGMIPYQSKSKYADISGLIASNNAAKRLEKADEFIKSGIKMKTIRLGNNGMPKESMSFKNIDYEEVFDNSEWTESELYEQFTNRFFFVVFEPETGREIRVLNTRSGKVETEPSFVLSKVFFWTMPPRDLEVAKEYWENIRRNVLTNNISLKSFWSISDKRMFHVRPKATKADNVTSNPNGGTAHKYCYWFNADYVKKIIDND